MIEIEPIKRLYLYWLDTGGGHIEQVRMFTLIALFVLLIACINFMNLTTARSGNRAKEIGLRKVVGAYRADVILIGITLLTGIIAGSYPAIKAACTNPVNSLRYE